MNTEKITRQYYRREFYGGRNRVARLLDFLLFRAFMLFAGYVWFLSQVQNQLLAIALAAIAMLMVSALIELIKSIRFDAFVERKKKQLYAKALLEHIVLMPPKELRELLVSTLPSLAGCTDIVHHNGGFVAEQTFYVVIQQHPSEEILPSRLIKLLNLARPAHCDKLEIYSTARFSADTAELADKVDGLSIALHEPSDLIALVASVNALPKEETIQEMIVAETAKERQKFRRISRTVFLPVKTRRYLYCAGIIVSASFITGYRVYYPLAAAVCICLAIFSWWYSWRSTHVKPSESSDSAKNVA